MKLIYDLDGTLYDSLSLIHSIDMANFRKLGYSPMPVEEYVTKFQAKDWRKLYRDLGIREEHIDEVINSFYIESKKVPLPLLIPFAKKVVDSAKENIGLENLGVITTRPHPECIELLSRDGLDYLLGNIRCPKEDKSEALFKVTIGTDGPVIYLADLVSDGEACLEARSKGASNLLFLGITHRYALSPPGAMQEFVSQHLDFAQVLNCLKDLPRLWNRKSSP